MVGAKTITDKDWAAYIDHVEFLSAPDTIASRSVVYMTTSVPSAHQRRRMAERMTRKAVDGGRSVLLTESAVARMAMTGYFAVLKLRRSDQQFIASKPQSLEHAFDWLGVQREHHARIVEQMREAMTAVGYDRARIHSVRLR